jgi:hypothetical protein
VVARGCSAALIPAFTAAEVDAGAAVIAAVVLDEVRVTVLPFTGSPLASRSSTVTVAAVLPSATTLVALDTTLESLIVGSTGGGVPKVTATICDSGRLSVVSVAE